VGGAQFGNGAWIRGLPDFVILCHPLLPRRDGEVVFCLVVDGVLESRPDLLYLRLRPVYGIGGVACTLFFYRFNQEPITALSVRFRY